MNFVRPWPMLVADRSDCVADGGSWILVDGSRRFCLLPEMDFHRLPTFRRVEVKPQKTKGVFAEVDEVTTRSTAVHLPRRYGSHLQWISLRFISPQLGRHCE